jgi:arylsulfatase A-like enzyme
MTKPGLLLTFAGALLTLSMTTAVASPNILLIIADDQGVDASAQYPYSDDPPSTPALDGLAAAGVVFDNVWATPSCATTRASILTGKYGFQTGFNRTPGQLDPEQQTIQQFLAADERTRDYASGVFGKWHVGGRDENHPATVGIEHYAGSIGNPGDYFDWELTVNGATSIVTEYHTTRVTDLAIEWIQRQDGPWFAWVAYSAPHLPFHQPPAQLHGRDLTGSRAELRQRPREYYLAAIEAMDREIGRLLQSMPAADQDNTVVIYVGDNGTPRRVVDRGVFDAERVKGTLYEGGIRVPMLVSGGTVTREGQREDALVSVVDLFATIAEIAGAGRPGAIDGISFAAALVDADFVGRQTVYAGYEDKDLSGWAIRNARYKLLVTDVGDEQLFDLAEDLREANNLLDAGGEASAIKADLAAAAERLQQGAPTASPADDQSVDITDAVLTARSANCADYADRYTSRVRDVLNETEFSGTLDISVDDGKCVFRTNAIPNHDFNDSRGFAHDVATQDDVYEITTMPVFANETTPLSLVFDNAIMLNGVKADLIAAACHGVRNERTGCNDMRQPWRFDPMHRDNGFRVDSHNAHTQPDGTYHYHGSPNALFEPDGSVESPVIGFAADGFPIFGPWILDNGETREVRSSYRLKAGERPAGGGSPGGQYDGQFRDDYEYVSGSGDLDECNGMTLDGVYGYYVTQEFPYMLTCFKGAPDASFRKRQGRRRPR